MPLEAAEVMVPEHGPEPEVFAAFRSSLPLLQLREHARSAFYDEARGSDVGIVVATGEDRLFSNILVTIGVV